MSADDLEELLLCLDLIESRHKINMRNISEIRNKILKEI